MLDVDTLIANRAVYSAKMNEHANAFQQLVGIISLLDSQIAQFTEAANGEANCEKKECTAQV